MTENESGAGVSTYPTSLFGDSSDGYSSLYPGAPAPSWAAKDGSVFTMTRDAHCWILQVAEGATLVCAGFRIFADKMLTNLGTITADGLSGASDGAAGGRTTSGTVAGGCAGGPGGLAAGTAGNNTGSSVLGVGSGGVGGAGPSGAGGNRGFAGHSGIPWMFRSPQSIGAGMVGYNNAVRPLGGGASGGGGGGDSLNSGGGGGGGGGVILIAARQLLNGGVLSAVGGNGGTPTAGNCGGGGGGGGGLILLYTPAHGYLTDSGTVRLQGGSGGGGSGTGLGGGAGATGFSGKFEVR